MSLVVVLSKKSNIEKGEGGLIRILQVHINLVINWVSHLLMSLVVASCMCFVFLQPPVSQPNRKFIEMREKLRLRLKEKKVSDVCSMKPR